MTVTWNIDLKKSKENRNLDLAAEQDRGLTPAVTQGMREQEAVYEDDEEPVGDALALLAADVGRLRFFFFDAGENLASLVRRPDFPLGGLLGLGGAGFRPAKN